MATRDAGRQKERPTATRRKTRDESGVYWTLLSAFIGVISLFVSILTSQLSLSFDSSIRPDLGLLGGFLSNLIPLVGGLIAITVGIFGAYRLAIWYSDRRRQEEKLIVDVMQKESSFFSLVQADIEQLLQRRSVEASHEPSIVGTDFPKLRPSSAEDSRVSG